MDKIEMTMRKRAGKIYDVFLGEMHLFTASKLVAEPICNSFNEHDTLKAKAELFDEVVATLATFRNTDRYKDMDVAALVAKAKELQ